MSADALPPIPDKLFFKIGEVTRLVGVPAHVLRFWEDEFAQVRPTRTASGHRLYARHDVERLRQIRALLHDRRFTLAGVRALLARGSATVEAAIELEPPAPEPVAPSPDARVAELTRARDEATRALRAAERELAAVRAEAQFWKERATRGSIADGASVDRARAQLAALRKWARGDVEG